MALDDQGVVEVPFDPKEFYIVVDKLKNEDRLVRSDGAHIIQHPQTTILNWAKAQKLKLVKEAIERVAGYDERVVVFRGEEPVPEPKGIVEKISRYFRPVKPRVWEHRVVTMVPRMEPVPEAEQIEFVVIPKDQDQQDLLEAYMGLK